MTKEPVEIPSKPTRFDDGIYEFAPIYDEAYDMIVISNIVYSIASMRDLEWRQEKLKKDGTHEQLINFSDPDFMRPEINPETKFFCKGIHMNEIAKYVSDNLDEIKKDELFYHENKMTLEMLKRTKNSWGEVLLYIDDREGDEREVVYSICIDPETKRIIVTFRGTAVYSDLLMDATIKQTSVKLPNCSARIKLHSGFYNYMFSKDSYEEGEGEVEDISKFESIIHRILPLIQEYKDYKLYVSGHSLGASLATLFAFCASNDERIPKPVTCISVASPYCGNEAWRESFIQSERAGNLRHLRISNETDVIPHGPPFGAYGNLYKHVGVNLRLENDEKMLNSLEHKPRFCFQYRGGAIAEIGHAFANSFLVNCSILPSQILKMHSCSEYARRIDLVKPELKKIYLNDLYEKYFNYPNKVPYQLWNTGSITALVLVTSIISYFICWRN